MVEVTKHVRTTIRYDGPALYGHEMDVQDLAPALLALADLIQLANQKFNGGQANMKVLVNADVEQKCFMIDISLVQTFLEQAKGLLGTDNVKTAKEIAEWVGILVGGGAGLFQLVKFLRKARQGDQPLQIQNMGDGNVTISGNGNTIVVSRQVFQLAQEPKAIEKVKAITRPLENEGYDSLAFVDGVESAVEFTKDEAAEIGELPQQPLSDIPTESVSRIRGQVRIKSAEYEGGAQWALLWNGRAINAEMVEKAADWVISFQENKVSAPPNSNLDVSMIETVQLDTQGLAVGKRSYKVMEVHGVTLPPQQTSFLDQEPPPV